MPACWDSIILDKLAGDKQLWFITISLVLINATFSVLKPFYCKKSRIEQLVVTFSTMWRCFESRYPVIDAWTHVASSCDCLWWSFGVFFGVLDTRVHALVSTRRFVFCPTRIKTYLPGSYTCQSASQTDRPFSLLTKQIKSVTFSLVNRHRG